MRPEPPREGDTHIHEWTTEEVVERDERYEATGTAVRRNEEVVVMTGFFEGLVRKE